jgi:hypothetical protein
MRLGVIVLLVLFCVAPVFGYWGRREAGLFDAAFDGGIMARWPLTTLTTPAGNVFSLTFAHRFAAAGLGARSEIYVPQLETYLLAVSPTELLWRAPGLRSRTVKRPDGAKKWTVGARVFFELGENQYQVDDADGVSYYYSLGELTHMIVAGEKLHVKACNGRIEEISVATTDDRLLRVTYDEAGCTPTSIETPEGVFIFETKQGCVLRASRAGEVLVEFSLTEGVLTQVRSDASDRRFMWQRNPYLRNPRAGVDSVWLLQSDGHATYRWLYSGDFLRIEGLRPGGRTQVFEYLGRSGQVTRSALDE